MSIAVLKRRLGEAGAGQDSSHDDDTLYALLAAMVDAPPSLNARQTTIATGVLAAAVSHKATTVECVLSADVGTTGVSGSTTLQARKNGVAFSTITVGNAEADGTSVVNAAVEVELAAGDVLDLNVSAAPGTGANLSATLLVRPATIEA